MASGAQIPGNDGDLKHAEALLSQAIEDYPDDERSYIALAKLEIDRVINHPNSMTKTPYYSTSIKELLDKALSINPRSFDALTWLAKYHEYRKEYQAALAVDEKALKLKPDRTDFRIDFMIHVGRCLLMMNRLEEAEARLLSLVKLTRSTGDTTNLIFSQELLGKVYVRQKRYKEAEHTLVAAVKQAEATDLAACPYAALGELYEIVGDDAKSVETASRAADMESGKPNMQYAAADRFFEHANYDKALHYLRRALAMQPNNKSYMDMKAKILAAMKPRPPAEEFKKAYGFFEDHDFNRAMVYINRALAGQKSARFKVVKGYLLLLKKKYKEAEALFRQARKSDPVDTGAAVGLGHLHIVRKNYAGARRMLEQPASEDNLEAEGCNPWPPPYASLTHRMACLGMGWLLANQGEHRKALVYFERALDSKGDDIFALLGKGNSLNALGMLNEAQKLFEEVLEEDKHNRYAIAELALVYLNKGKLDQAERLFKTARELDVAVHYTCPYEGLGMVYMRAGKLKQAKDNFSKAIKINPNIEYKKYNGLAKIYIQEGKYDKARQLLRKSIENYPYDDEARKLQKSILHRK